MRRWTFDRWAAVTLYARSVFKIKVQGSFEDSNVQSERNMLEVQDNKMTSLVVTRSTRARYLI